jgi:hypothetical protein
MLRLALKMLYGDRAKYAMLLHGLTPEEIQIVEGAAK